MSAADLARWQTWYRISLPGEARLEHYLAQICALLSSGGKPRDFAPDLRTPQERMALERVRMKAEQDFEVMKQSALKMNGAG